MVVGDVDVERQTVSSGAGGSLDHNAAAAKEPAFRESAGTQLSEKAASRTSRLSEP